METEMKLWAYQTAPPARTGQSRVVTTRNTKQQRTRYIKQFKDQTSRRQAKLDVAPPLKPCRLRSRRTSGVAKRMARPATTNHHTTAANRSTKQHWNNGCATQQDRPTPAKATSQLTESQASRPSSTAKQPQTGSQDTTGSDGSATEEGDRPHPKHCVATEAQPECSRERMPSGHLISHDDHKPEHKAALSTIVQQQENNIKRLHSKHDVAAKAHAKTKS